MAARLPPSRGASASPSPIPDAAADILRAQSPVQRARSPLDFPATTAPDRPKKVPLGRLTSMTMSNIPSKAQQHTAVHPRYGSLDTVPALPAESTNGQLPPGANGTAPRPAPRKGSGRSPPSGPAPVLPDPAPAQKPGALDPLVEPRQHHSNSFGGSAAVPPVSPAAQEHTVDFPSFEERAKLRSSLSHSNLDQMVPTSVFSAIGRQGSQGSSGSGGGGGGGGSGSGGGGFLNRGSRLSTVALASMAFAPLGIGSSVNSPSAPEATTPHTDHKIRQLELDLQTQKDNYEARIKDLEATIDFQTSQLQILQGVEVEYGETKRSKLAIQSRLLQLLDFIDAPMTATMSVPKIVDEVHRIVGQLDNEPAVRQKSSMSAGQGDDWRAVGEHFSDGTLGTYRLGKIQFRRPPRDLYWSSRVTFFTHVQRLLADWIAGSDDLSQGCAASIWYQTSRAIGREDIKALQPRLGTDEAKALMLRLPSFLDHTSVASCTIAQESVLTDLGDLRVYVRATATAETLALAAAHGHAKTQPQSCCVFAAGYMAGWASHAYKVAVDGHEIGCMAKGDPHCTFVLAPPDKLDAVAEDYASKIGLPLKKAAPLTGTPAIFQRLNRLTVLEDKVTSLLKVEQVLKQENENANALLHNMLPPKAAESLKNGHALYGEVFENTTIIFSDIVGFTKLAGKLTPEELVSVLNRLYSAFDRLCDNHGTYKLETVGDAYMVVAGCPEPQPNHAERAAAMALDMLREISNVEFTDHDGKQHRLEMRIGIHSGQVIGGVVGHRMPRFHLFGDTVVISSRMESHGIKGAIQVSSDTYELLHNTFVFEKRGTVEVKGRGPMTTYLLQGRRSGAPTSLAAPNNRAGGGDDEPTPAARPHRDSDLSMLRPDSPPKANDL